MGNLIENLYVTLGVKDAQSGLALQLNLIAKIGTYKELIRVLPISCMF